MISMSDRSPRRRREIFWGWVGFVVGLGIAVAFLIIQTPWATRN